MAVYYCSCYCCYNRLLLWWLYSCYCCYNRLLLWWLYITVVVIVVIIILKKIFNSANWFCLCRGELSSAPPRILGRPLSVISDTDGMGEVYENIKTRRFRPKTRKQDVDLYVESCRTKFGCFVHGDQLTGERCKGAGNKEWVVNWE